MKKPSASKEVRPSWKKHPKGRYHTRIFDPLWSKLLPKKKISNTYCRPSLDSFYKWVEGRPHSSNASYRVHANQWALGLMILIYTNNEEYLMMGISKVST